MFLLQPMCKQKLITIRQQHIHTYIDSLENQKYIVVLHNYGYMKLLFPNIVNFHIILS